MLNSQPLPTNLSASFQLRRRDLSVWNVEKQEWQIVRGDYKLLVGSSSRDLKVSGMLTV
jgi:beta-glucosidase